jgi:hypothetical protein
MHHVRIIEESGIKAMSAIAAALDVSLEILTPAPERH